MKLLPSLRDQKRRKSLGARKQTLVSLEWLEERVLLTDPTVEVEPNNELATATPLPLFTDPADSGFLTSAVASGALDPGNDNDYWSFAAQQGDRLVVDAERTSGNISPRFYVYNAAGQILVNGDSYGNFGSPSKSTAPAYTIPADGTYYVRMGNQGGTGSYQFRVDLGRSVQLEPYDFGQANNSIAGASGLAYAAGAPGHLTASVAGSLYSGEGLDYYRLGRLDPGNRVDVASRAISVSGLTYKVQVVGATAGTLSDQDGSQADPRATVLITQADEYYLKIEANSGVGLRGQYLIDIDVQDTVPPRITSVTGIPAEGDTVGLHLNPITLNFSEDLQTAGVNAAATYELRAAGPDAAFGTADDVVYTLSRSGGSRSVSLTVADGPLQPGAYRFTAQPRGSWTGSATRSTATATGPGGMTSCGPSRSPSPPARPWRAAATTRSRRRRRCRWRRTRRARASSPA